jgi:hypothetical protein
MIETASRARDRAEARLVETKERGNGGANTAYVREYSYTMFNTGSGIAGRFRP